MMGVDEALEALCGGHTWEALADIERGLSQVGKQKTFWWNKVNGGSFNVCDSSFQAPTLAQKNQKTFSTARQ